MIVVGYVTRLSDVSKNSVIGSISDSDPDPDPDLDLDPDHDHDHDHNRDPNPNPNPYPTLTSHLMHTLEPERFLELVFGAKVHFSSSASSNLRNNRR